MGSFDAYVGGFTDYVKRLVSQNPAAFGVASQAPVYTYDPVMGQVVQQNPQVSSDPMTSVWQPVGYGNQFSPPPTLNGPAPTSTPMGGQSAPKASSGPKNTFAPAPTYSPSNPWRENANVQNAYGQSAGLYKNLYGNTGSSQFSQFANDFWNNISTWNQTYNSAGGPQVRAFAPNPYGYDANGSLALSDASGNYIYADDPAKIAEALKRLEEQRAAAAAASASTATFSLPNPTLENPQPWRTP